MAVPKKKPSRSQSSTKVSAWRKISQKKIGARIAVSRCLNCNETKLSHSICQSCGEYKGEKSKATSTKKAPSKTSIKKAGNNESKKNENKETSTKKK